MKRIIKMLLAPFAVFSLALGVTISINSQKDVIGAEAANVAGTYTYDFVSKFDTYAKDWTSSYTTHSVTEADLESTVGVLPDASISFSSANKQGSTITTMPVSKSNETIFDVTASGLFISKVEVYFTQWTTKTQTVTVKETDSSGTTLLDAQSVNFSTGTGEVLVGSNINKLYIATNKSKQIGWNRIVVTLVAGTIKPVTGITLDKYSSPAGGFIVGQTDQVTATIAPSDATNQNIDWTTLDGNVATVSTNGLVTAVGAGTTTITATTVDGGFSKTYSATVIARVLNSIAIKTAATKTTFKVGESFSSTGLVLTADYNSGPLDVSTGFTTNLDSKVFTTGDIAAGVVVTVTLEGKTVTYTIDVEAAPLAVHDLFFSEYVEGSSNNKYLEIYNPLSTSVNLDDYTIRLYSNGSSTVSSSIELTGTLAAFDVYTIRHTSAALTLTFTPDLANETVLGFNGDDALSIYNEVLAKEVDIFGQIGYDPGKAWTVGGVSTVDKTLVRKPSITRGDQVGGDTFDPSAEWDMFDIDVVTNLNDAANGAYVLAEYLMASDTADQCITKFTIAKNDYFLKLSPASANLFQNDTETYLTSARLRYIAWASNQHENPYSAEPLSGLSISNENSTDVLMTVVIGSIGLTLILGYYFLKKKEIKQ